MQRRATLLSLVAIGLSFQNPVQAATWEEVPHPLTSNVDEVLLDVDALASDDIWAAGYRWTVVGGALEFRTHALRWNGSEWQVQNTRDVESAPSTTLLNGIDAVAPDNVWAVGYYRRPRESSQALVEHWDGSEWRIEDVPAVSATGNFLHAVSAAGRNQVWAVGSAHDLAVESRPLVLRRRGERWSVVPVDVLGFCSGSTFLTDVQARGAGRVWVSGYCRGGEGVNQAFLLRWDGLAWHVELGPGQIVGRAELNSIELVGGTFAWAVGTRHGETTDTPMFWRFMDGAWSEIPPPAGVLGSVGDIAATTRRRAYAVGIASSSQPPFAGRLALYWNGRRWVREEAGDFGSINGVTVAGEDAWGVGQNIDDSLILRRSP